MALLFHLHNPVHNRAFYSCGLGVLAFDAEHEAEIDLVLIQTSFPFLKHSNSSSNNSRPRSATVLGLDRLNNKTSTILRAP